MGVMSQVWPKVKNLLKHKETHVKTTQMNPNQSKSTKSGISNDEMMMNYTAINNQFLVF